MTEANILNHFECKTFYERLYLTLKLIKNNKQSLQALILKYENEQHLYISIINFNF